MTLAAGGLSGVLPQMVVVLCTICAVAGMACIRLCLPGAWRWWRGLRAPRRRVGEPLPRWIAVLLPVADTLAAPMGPRLPLRLRRVVHAMLRRAGVDEQLQSAQWLALVLLLVLAAVAVAAALPGGAPFMAVLPMAAGAMPWMWLREAALRREREALRDLPFYLDMITLALEAGGTLSVALRAATERAPDSALRRAFERVQIDLRAGRSRADALRALGDRMSMPAIAPLVAALVQADASGSSLATVLRVQADQRLAERFNVAERRALEAPVKMLAPLVLCIFPCTFLVLAFPLVVRFLGE